VVAAQTSTRGEARWVADGPVDGPVTLLVRTPTEGALVSLRPGAPTRITTEPLGTISVLAEAGETVCWALTHGGVSLPALSGPSVALPPGAYGGIVAVGRGLHPVAVSVEARGSAQVPTQPQPDWTPPPGWNTSPATRADVSLDDSGPIQPVADAASRLILWRERDGLLETQPWPGRATERATPTRSVRFETARGPAREVIATGISSTGWFRAEGTGALRLPEAARDVRVWTDDLWAWPVAVPAEPATVELPVATDLEIQVFAADGRPAAAAQVQWWANPTATSRLDPSPQGPPTATTTTDERGTARFPRTGALAGVARVDHPRGLPLWLAIPTVEAPRTRASCRLEAGGTIEGAVRGADGKPIHGVRVWARAPRMSDAHPPRWAETDASGQFRIAGLATDVDYVLTASQTRGVETFAARAVRVTAGTRDLALQLQSEDPPPPGGGRGH